MSSVQGGKPTTEPDLWKPVLSRAVIALAFGLLTVFWPDISVLFRAVATGVYFLLSALAVGLLLLDIRRGLPAAVGPLSAEVAIFLIGGVLALIFQDGAGFVVIAGAVLILTGLFELYLGFRQRSRTVLGRDWLITGGIAVLAALLLGLLAGTSQRAPIGVLGGAAVIIGVVTALAALSYRHDGSVNLRADEKQALPGVE